MSDTIKKRWKVRTINNKTDVSFLPVFTVNRPGDVASSMTFDTPIASDKEIECTHINVSIPYHGKDIELTFNFLDLYMFIYFCANEELRQQLQMKYERQVSYIPYDVTFRIDKEEKEKGLAKRRIELPVDELVMAIARNDAWKMRLAGKINK